MINSGTAPAPDFYTGEVKDDHCIRHGVGTWIQGSGLVYCRGNWRDDMLVRGEIWISRNATGKQMLKEDHGGSEDDLWPKDRGEWDTYRGELSERTSQPEGFGVACLRWIGGEFWYVGMWQAGRAHGKGAFIRREEEREELIICEWRHGYRKLGEGEALRILKRRSSITVYYDDQDGHPFRFDAAASPQSAADPCQSDTSSELLKLRLSDGFMKDIEKIRCQLEAEDPKSCELLEVVLESQLEIASGETGMVEATDKSRGQIVPLIAFEFGPPSPMGDNHERCRKDCCCYSRLGHNTADLITQSFKCGLANLGGRRDLAESFTSTPPPLETKAGVIMNNHPLDSNMHTSEDFEEEESIYTWVTDFDDSAATTLDGHDKQAKIIWPDGTNYIGEIDPLSKLPHGLGRFVAAGGDVCEGSWSQGFASGDNCHYIFKEKDHATYEGALKNGRKHGHGILRFGHMCYEGSWRNDRPHGFGKMTNAAEGLTYEGEWVNGRIQGKGKLTGENWGAYEGSWVDAVKQGQGRAQYVNGGKYEGEWANDKAHGQGRYTWPDGSVYEGSFVHGEMDGFGVLTRKLEGGLEVTYEGGYQHNLKSEYGSMIFSDGAVYEGEWKNDRPHGNGMFRNPYGVLFRGNFVEGRYVPNVDGSSSSGDPRGLPVAVIEGSSRELSSANNKNSDLDSRIVVPCPDPGSPEVLQHMPQPRRFDRFASVIDGDGYFIEESKPIQSAIRPDGSNRTANLHAAGSYLYETRFVAEYWPHGGKRGNIEQEKKSERINVTTDFAYPSTEVTTSPIMSTRTTTTTTTGSHLQRQIETARASMPSTDGDMETVRDGDIETVREEDGMSSYDNTETRRATPPTVLPVKKKVEAERETQTTSTAAGETTTIEQSSDIRTVAAAVPVSGTTTSRVLPTGSSSSTSAASPTGRAVVTTKTTRRHQRIQPAAGITTTTTTVTTEQQRSWMGGADSPTTMLLTKREEAEGVPPMTELGTERSDTAPPVPTRTWIEERQQDQPTERIVEVPVIAVREVIKPVIIDDEIEVDVPVEMTVYEGEDRGDRIIPVPVESQTNLELLLPQLRSRRTAVDVPIFVPRFVEVPVAVDDLTVDQIAACDQLRQDLLNAVGTNGVNRLGEFENLASRVLDVVDQIITTTTAAAQDSHEEQVTVVASKKGGAAAAAPPPTEGVVGCPEGAPMALKRDVTAAVVAANKSGSGSTVVVSQPQQYNASCVWQQQHHPEIESSSSRIEGDWFYYNDPRNSSVVHCGDGISPPNTHPIQPVIEWSSTVGPVERRRRRLFRPNRAEDSCYFVPSLGIVPTRPGSPLSQHVNTQTTTPTYSKSSCLVPASSGCMVMVFDK